VLSSIPPRHAALGGREAVERCAAGDTRQSGAMTLQVLQPPVTDYERKVSTNAMSCVVRVQAGSVAVLLTGDIPADREAALAAREPVLQAQLLMAPHHGSRSSSSPALLAAVAPSMAIAQSGYRNRYGHPDPGVVDRAMPPGAWSWPAPTTTVRSSGARPPMGASSTPRRAPRRCVTGTTAPSRGRSARPPTPWTRTGPTRRRVSRYPGCRRSLDWCTSC
jgi:hypothetical protein